MTGPFWPLAAPSSVMTQGERRAERDVWTLAGGRNPAISASIDPKRVYNFPGLRDSGVDSEWLLDQRHQNIGYTAATIAMSRPTALNDFVSSTSQGAASLY